MFKPVSNLYIQRMGRQFSSMHINRKSSPPARHGLERKGAPEAVRDNHMRKSNKKRKIDFHFGWH